MLCFGVFDIFFIRVLKIVSYLVSLRLGFIRCLGFVSFGVRRVIEVVVRLGFYGFVVGFLGFIV